MGKSSIWPQIFAAASASLIFLCGGFHFGWVSSSLPQLYGDPDMSITLSQISWIISILFIGIIFGAFLGSILVSLCGRKTTLLVMTVPFVFSCVLLIFARSYWWFYLARFIAGIGVGVAFTVTPMYIGEIAESRIRGSLCALMPVMVRIGHLLPLFIGPFVAKAALEIVGAIIPIIFATSFLWAPESPYYYSMKRNRNETQKSVAWLRGTSDVVQEVQQIDDSIALNRRKGTNFLNLFIVLGNRKALMVIILLFTAQTLSGDTVLGFYSMRFFHTSGVEINPSLIYIALELIQLVTSICIVFLVDKVGRRPLLLISASLCMVFLLAEALYDQLGGDESDVWGISLIPVVALIGYLISHSIGLGMLPIVVAGEIFSCEVKAFALALSTAFHFALGVGVSMLLTLIMYYIDGRYVIFYVFAACNLVSAILIHFFVPETKGRSLSEIQAAFQGRFNTVF